MEVKPAIVRVT